MSEKTPGELTRSLQGLFVCIALIIVGVLAQANMDEDSDLGGIVIFIGAIGFLFFGLSTAWAAVAAAIRGRRS